MRKRKRLWREVPIKDRKSLVHKIRRVLSKYIVSKDIPKLVRSVFTKNFDYGMHDTSKDYLAKSAIVENIARELVTLRRKEHQSGAFQALLSACTGSNITVLEVANQLKVHRNTVSKAWLPPLFFTK